MDQQRAAAPSGNLVISEEVIASIAVNAAKDAMNGWDPTYGCLYYYNPVTATSQWIFSRETVTTIGKHVFAI